MICWTRKIYCLSYSNNKLAKLTIESANKQSLLSCEDHGALEGASPVTAVKEDESSASAYADNKHLLQPS
jgi:hypothetical protein